MKPVLLIVLAALFYSSCKITEQTGAPVNKDYNDTLITQSLFNDKAATITEEGIQKILDGTYKLPELLRVAVIRLDNNMPKSYYYWNDEDYLKTQQAYLHLFEEKFKQSARVTKISVIPDLLIPKTPSFTLLREAAVRMQADVVVVYSIAGDLYSKYKFFTRPEIKAFATTQLIILDVRTGLIPFSTIITKDILSQKKKDEVDNNEARNRILHEAVLLTINDIGEKVILFFKN